jgi:hypothetical protein
MEYQGKHFVIMRAIKPDASLFAPECLRFNEVEKNETNHEGRVRN